jgi:hypothetical protein
VTEPQPQQLAYLSHRQSLTRHPDPSLLGKGSELPVIEDCQRRRQTPVPLNVITITGTDDHDPPESIITINWIE